MKKHNGIISFWKFIFCMMMVIFHTGHYYKDLDLFIFEYGSIGVEFFFIVSGYFMAKSALKNNKKDNENIGKETFIYIWKKIKSFFPYVVLTFVLALILKFILNDVSIKKCILSIWDILLLKMSGIKSTDIVGGHLWYISAMLICMSLLYPQIKKFKDNYFYLIAPLTVILVSGWLNRNYGNLRDPFLWIGFTYKGMVRAYFEICLGSLLYYINQKVKRIKFTMFGRLCLTIVEIGGFISVMLVSHFIDATRYDYVLVLIIAISTLFAFSEKTLELNLFNNKLFYFLEKISLPVYLLHIPIIKFLVSVDLIRNLGYFNVMIILIISSFLFGAFALFIVEHLKKKEYYIPNIKKIFISE